MNRLLLAGSTLACLTVGALATPASAAVPGNGAPNLTSALTQEAQFVWRGARYCFYPRGWHGPGWYRCGFAWRRGFGWGGGYGWHGWDYRRGAGEMYRERREYRRGGRDFEMRRGGRDMEMRGGEMRRGGRDSDMRGGEMRRGGDMDRGGSMDRSGGATRSPSGQNGGGRNGGNFGAGSGGGQGGGGGDRR